MRARLQGSHCERQGEGSRLGCGWGMAKSSVGRVGDTWGDHVGRDGDSGPRRGAPSGRGRGDEPWGRRSQRCLPFYNSFVLSLYLTHKVRSQLSHLKEQRVLQQRVLQRRVSDLLTKYSFTWSRTFRFRFRSTIQWA